MCNLGGEQTKIYNITTSANILGTPCDFSQGQIEQEIVMKI